MQTRTVEVGHVSDLATEREIHEFFSFSGEIEHIEILQDAGQPKTAFVTFKDPAALEIALLLSGATIVDQIVSITPAENYVPKIEILGVTMVDNSVSMGPEITSSNSESSIISAIYYKVIDWFDTRQYVLTCLSLMRLMESSGVQARHDILTCRHQDMILQKRLLWPMSGRGIKTLRDTLQSFWDSPNGKDKEALLQKIDSL